MKRHFTESKESYRINHHGAAETGFAGDGTDFREDGHPELVMTSPGCHFRAWVGGFCETREQALHSVPQGERCLLLSPADTGLKL